MKKIAWFAFGLFALSFVVAGGLLYSQGVKGRAFGSPLARGLYPRASTAETDPQTKPGALTRDVNTRLSTAETDPQTKPGAPAAAPAAVGCRPRVQVKIGSAARDPGDARE